MTNLSDVRLIEKRCRVEKSTLKFHRFHALYAYVYVYAYIMRLLGNSNVFLRHRRNGAAISYPRDFSIVRFQNSKQFVIVVRVYLVSPLL